jgi:hypothetical protein
MNRNISFQDIRVAEEGDEYLPDEGSMGELNKKLTSSKKKRTKQTFYMQF